MQKPTLLKTLAGVKVLCVDDNADALELLSITLRNYGAVVTCMASAELGIKCLTANCFDVVVSDLKMPPGLDGYDLAHALRTMEESDPSRVVTPTIAVSADANALSRKKRFADFQVYLAKPFDQRHLVTIVARLAQADGDAVKAGTLAVWEEQERAAGR